MEQSPNPLLKKLISLIFRWKRFIVLHTLVVVIAAVVISLVIPLTFSSGATILPPGGSPLSSILPPAMTGGLGGAISALTGDPGSDTFRILSILKSKSMAIKVIDEFDLKEFHEADTIEDAIESYREMVNYTIDEEAMITVRCYAKTKFFHPEDDEKAMKLLSYDMCNFILNELEMNFSNLQSEKAKRDRIVVEQRLNQNISDLKDVENELKDFSEEFGVIALPEQIEAMVLASASLESRLMISEIELASMEQALTDNSAEIKNQTILVEELKTKLDEMRNAGTIDSLSVLPSFKTAPDLALTYAQLFREQELQTLLYQFLTQQYEQLKIQESQETPKLQFIDTPTLPEKRTAPTRSITAILIFIIGMLIGVTFIILYEEYNRRFKGQWKAYIE